MFCAEILVILICSIADSRYTVVDSILLGLGIMVGVALIINAVTWTRMTMSMAVPAKRRVQRIANRCVALLSVQHRMCCFDL